MSPASIVIANLGLPFLVALGVSAVLVPVCRVFALRAGCIVQPSDDAYHSRAVALFGGVAIGVTLLACSAGFGLVGPLGVLLACGGAVMVFGAAHDLLTFKPATKLVAQIAVASLLLFFNYRLYWSTSITVDSIATIIWIVGVTSAFNLLDNMDGLCGGIALIAGAAFLLVAPASPGTLPVAQYLAILLGATAGFLAYNLYPASIVLGDSGSLLIGLSMAVVPLRLAPGSGSNLLSIVAVPVFVLLIPLGDAAVAAVTRLRARRTDGPEAEPSASSHRLVALGLPPRSAVRLLWLLSAGGGVIGVLAKRTDRGLTGLVAAVFILGLALFAMYLARVRVHADPGPDRAPGAITPLGIEFVARRRFVEVMLDAVLVSVAYYGAFRLRFEGVEYRPQFEYFLQSFPLVLGTQVVALFVVGAYRGMWRYFGLADGVTFVQGVILGVAGAEGLLFYLYRFSGYSQEVFIVYAMLLLILLVGSRASFRLISEFVQRQRQVGRRLVIYGAGDAGSIAIRHLLNDRRSAYRIVGFIDDDKRKHSVRVHGFRVLGGYEDLVDMIMAGEVDAVAVTHQASSTSGLERVCARYGVTLYRLRVHWLEIASGDAHAHSGAIEFDRAPSTPAAPVSLVPPPSASRPSREPSAHVRHAFSVDVEDWFHGIPVDQEMKSAQAPRLERGLHVLLDLLAERGVHGTFFILGPLASQYPRVIRRIGDEGHELGCHGWSHDLVYQMSRERFAEETVRARDAIEDLTGRAVQAYRAAYFSITQDSLWALEVLAGLGFKYDSSIFPVRNWRYGIANFSRDPILVDTPAGSIWEFPISVMNRYGQTIPVSGGAYFRLYPYGLTRSNFRQQERLGRSVIFYLHPWELDADHPQVPFAFRPRLTHYANLQSTRPKLVRLLREFDFGTIGDVVAAKV